MKSATRLMGRKYPPRSLQGFKGGRRKRYSELAKKHLERLWRSMGYMWPGRMKAALAEWLKHDDHSEALGAPGKITSKINFLRTNPVTGEKVKEEHD